VHDPELEYIEHIKEAPLKLIIVSLESSSPHWHEEYEVIFVLRGSVSVGGVLSCELDSGDILLVNPRDVHSFRKSGSDNICLILQFSPSIITEVYDKPFAFKLAAAKDGLIPEETTAIFQHLLAEMGLLLHERPDGYQFAIKSGLYAFIGAMFRYLKYEAAQGAVNMQSDEYLRDFDLIKQYIKLHFKENIGQDQIGHELGMSRSKVYRVLRQAGGRSTKDMTNYYRVEYAKHLLRNGENSITFIAQESGFESDSSFFRVFKESEGISPQKYRASPARKVEQAGIQGYSNYSAPDSIALLKSFYSAPSAAPN
jgi:AraC-like DNA-binding protein